LFSISFSFAVNGFDLYVYTTREQEIKYYKAKSTDTRYIDEIKHTSFDFIYLDGAHDHDNVKIELNLLWPLIRSGGVMAGTV